MAWRALDRDALAARLRRVRARTLALIASLSVDEQLAQPFADASPTKWHLGHTSWFFDRFVLATHARSDVDPHLEHVFNSYYEAIGDRQPRPLRSLVTRPTLEEVHAYRARIDAALEAFVLDASRDQWAKAAAAIELGTHHEEQHQELMLTDLLAVRMATRDSPGASVVASRSSADAVARTAEPRRWLAHDGGLVEIGWDPADGFAFDNEGPRHRVWLEPFEIASRAVTWREVLAFVEAGGYRAPSLWLSDGLATVRARGCTMPYAWQSRDGVLFEHTLAGLVPLQLDAPARHLSYYEADAIARFLGARLPSEAEWEVVARERASASLLPDPVGPIDAIAPEDRNDSLSAGVWQWTASAYGPYPRYTPFDGAFAEYNGKFMCSQLVLRGGSCFTPEEHFRVTYRNFFPPDARWQLSGVRLARWR